MSDRLHIGDDEGVAIGPFRLLPNRQLLLEDGAPVRLGSRAFEILKLLAEPPGELVTKEELVARVWPNTSCEVTDDGAAPAIFRPGTGTRLVDSLAAELDGHVQRRFGPEGTSVTLLFPRRSMEDEREVIAVCRSVA